MIVGICGNAGSGKDTAADFLIARHGFVRVALADPMKRFVREIYEFSDSQLWGPSEFRNLPDPRYRRQDGEPLTPRHALQQLGTEWARACCPDTWIDYMIRVSQKLEEGGYTYTQTDGAVPDAGWRGVSRNVVVSDCRFRNEVEAIKRAGGKVVRIQRGAPNFIGDQHISEKELQEIPLHYFDWFLDNSGTKERLAENVDFFVQQCVRVPG